MKRKEYLAEIGKVKNNTIIHTYSTRLVLPMLGFKSTDFKRLINVHITNLKDPQVIVILQDTDDSVVDLVRCQINDNYIEHYRDEDELCIRFRIPDQYYTDFNKFIDGKYSQLSTKYKEVLTYMYGQGVYHKGIDVSMYDILYPRLDKRKAIAEWTGEPLELIKEVMSSPDMSYELYKSLNQLKTTTILTNE